MWWTEPGDGDASSGARAGERARLEGRVPRPVAWLRQVHGADVVVIAGREDVRVHEGDALVTASPEVALAVATADCAPVALASPEGVVAAVHGGWRGLLAGVVESSVATMRSLGARTVVGALGPCVRAECYRFGEGELDAVARRLGHSVRGLTREGRPALDLPAAVGAALRAAGADLVHDEGSCTSCSSRRLFSHRARADAGRQAVVTWRE